MDVFCSPVYSVIRFAKFTATLEGRLDTNHFPRRRLAGENSGPIREMVLNRLGIFGIEVDGEANLKARFGGEGTITTANSRIPAMVISATSGPAVAENTQKQQVF